MKKESLLKIIGEDEMGLLKSQVSSSSKITSDQRLLESFEEINQFIRVNNREPSIGKEVQEHRLATRLQSLRKSQDKSKVLQNLDEFKLLNVSVKGVNSLNDIIQNDDLGILNEDEHDLFDLKNIPKITSMPDYVARRKPCKEFEKFEKLFLECQSDLSTGRRKLVKFANEQEIDNGYFFVLKGVLLYVAEIGKRKSMKGKINARLRCIFENGTESDMLLRSLSAELYKNGRRVTAHEDTHLDNFNGVTSEDSKTGFIYVVRSLSKEPKIQSIENLFKIGFSSTPVENRIVDAVNDPTYLMAPVSIVTTFECYNLNPQKLELILHNFFGESCLNIDIFDSNQRRHSPREWFIAPLNVIENAIELIISGGILKYRYDPDKQEIVFK